ncbi:LLM class flavin-dependent oxidoreductase [Euzebya pacifica]|nr:LLM class flavin-dependent oxidoreductase [Euzebya pacifica]
MSTAPLDSLGIGIPTLFAGRHFDRSSLIELLDVVEEGGAGAITVGDHLNWYTTSLECLSTMAFIAARTALPLMPNVLVLPLRQPFATMKMLTTIHHLSVGGVSCGVGVGGEHAREFAAAGLDPSERGPRTDEQLGIITRLLSGEVVDHDGPFYAVNQAHLDPLMAMPLLIGGRSRVALERVVRYGDGWTSAWCTPSQVRSRADELRELWKAAGRAGTPRVEAHTRVVLGKTVDAAWGEAGPFLQRHYGVDPEPFRRHTVCGPPDAVIPQLLAYYDVGVDRLNVTFAGDNQLAQAHWFMRDVLPVLAESRTGRDGD